MDIKELRIGNYIEFLGKIEQVEGVSIRLRPDVGYVEIKGISYPQKGFHFKPVELTEEWMSKFGFNSCLDDPECTGILTPSGQYNVISNGDYNLEIMFGFTKDGSVLVHLNDCDFMFCKYVHQLQNLYRSLTGEELSLNHS